MAAVDTSAAPGATPPLAAPAVAPLVGELEATAASYLEPEAFFVSWQGVLTLAFRCVIQDDSSRIRVHRMHPRRLRQLAAAASCSSPDPRRACYLPQGIYCTSGRPQAAHLRSTSQPASREPRHAGGGGGLGGRGTFPAAMLRRPSALPGGHSLRHPLPTARSHPLASPLIAGSKWPKSSLGCLREGQRLTPEQLAALTAVCHEESAAFAALRTAAAAAAQQQQHRHHHHHHQAPGGGAAAGSEAEAGATAGVRLAVDCAAVVLFECRSLERSISYHHVAFKGAWTQCWATWQSAAGLARLHAPLSPTPHTSCEPPMPHTSREPPMPHAPHLLCAAAGGLDGAPPAAEDLARVAAIVAEQDAPGYWFAASRDGNRERHYRAPHLGATLMHPLLPQCWGGGAGGAAAAGGQMVGGGWHADHDVVLMLAGAGVETCRGDVKVTREVLACMQHACGVGGSVLCARL